MAEQVRSTSRVLRPGKQISYFIEEEEFIGNSSDHEDDQVIPDAFLLDSCIDQNLKFRVVQKFGKRWAGE